MTRVATTRDIRQPLGKLALERQYLKAVALNVVQICCESQAFTGNGEL